MAPDDFEAPLAFTEDVNSQQAFITDPALNLNFDEDPADPLGFDPTMFDLVGLSPVPGYHVIADAEGRPIWAPDVGSTGATGAQGPQGVPGLDGQDGHDGERGPPGPQGDTGATGTAGVNGAQGVMGPPGPEGPQGPEGPMGPHGLQGDTGATGAVGPATPFLWTPEEPMLYVPSPPFVRHGHEDHTNRTRGMLISIGGSTPGGSLVAATADLTLRGTNQRYRAWAFDGAGTTAEAITLEFIVPKDYVGDGVFTLYFTNLGGGSGTVAWQLLAYVIQDGGGLNGAPTGNTTDVISAPSQNVLKVISHSMAVAYTPGDFVTFQVVRVPASDTLGNDAGLIAVEFSYTADM